MHYEMNLGQNYLFELTSKKPHAVNGSKCRFWFQHASVKSESVSRNLLNLLFPWCTTNIKKTVGPFGESLEEDIIYNSYFWRDSESPSNGLKTESEAIAVHCNDSYKVSIQQIQCLCNRVNWCIPTLPVYFSLGSWGSLAPAKSPRVNTFLSFLLVCKPIEECMPPFFFCTSMGPWAHAVQGPFLLTVKRKPISKEAFWPSSAAHTGRWLSWFSNSALCRQSYRIYTSGKEASCQSSFAS